MTEPFASGKRLGPANAPPVWAETRQELAESLDYYRAYQSGSYTVSSLCNNPELRHQAQAAVDSISDPTSYAYLLGGFGSARDAWAAGGRVIVSHGGGHAQSTDPISRESESAHVHAKVSAETAKAKPDAQPIPLPQLASSQSRHDARVAALLSSYVKRTPIILILGENYPLADFHLNCAFAVLGWYAVTACWAEKEANGMVRWKVRFQWLERQGHPWWLPSAPRNINKFTGNGHARTCAPSTSVWNPRKAVEVRSPSTFRHSNIDIGTAEVKHRRPVLGQGDDQSNIYRQVVQRVRHRDALRQHPLRKHRKLLAISSTRSKRLHLSKEGDCSQSCSYCGLPSPQVYTTGWTCLEPECGPGFWRYPHSATSLIFTEGFLHPAPRHLADLQIPFPVQPTSFQELHEARNPASQKQDDPVKGLFCDRCHRLSCREYFALQRCLHCHYTLIPSSITPQSPSYTTRRDILLYDTYVNPRFDVCKTHGRKGALDIVSWTLPNLFLGAKIHLLQHRGDASPDSPVDDILAAMQQPLSSEVLSDNRLDDDQLNDLWHGRLKLRRHELSMHRSCASGSKGRLLTQMFTQNVGEQYKHSTATKTVPLDQAPQSVALANRVLTERTSLVVNLKEPFNELYPCAYLRGMKMNFHDDGEPGLGPIVSSLSLGNVPAQMIFRLKRKFAQTEAPQLCKDDRHQDEGQSSSRGTVLSAYKTSQATAVVRSLGIPQHDRIMLSLPLRHGTIVVQEGRALQECFEHAVVPQWQENKNSDGVRFAITARRIN